MTSRVMGMMTRICVWGGGRHPEDFISGGVAGILQTLFQGFAGVCQWSCPHGPDQTAPGLT